MEFDYCHYCNVTLTSQKDSWQHKAGKKHIKKVLNARIAKTDVSSFSDSVSPLITSSCTEHTSGSHKTVVTCPDTTVYQEESDKLPNPVGRYCTLCSVHVNSHDQYIAHIHGQRHRKHVDRTSSMSATEVKPTLLNASESNVAASLAEDPCTEITLPTFSYCGVCRVNLLTSSKPDHDNSSDHLARFGAQTKSSVNGSPSNSIGFQRTCRKYLQPALPGITFTQAEANLMLDASHFPDDCLLYLPDGSDSYTRVGIHLVTALLRANLDSSSDPLAVWISPTIHTAPNQQLFGYYKYPSSTAKQFKTLQLYSADREAETCPRLTDISSGLVLTDADYFVHQLSPLLLAREVTCCCLVIQEAHLVALDSQICNRLKTYLATVPTSSRARVICLSDAHITTDCILKNFTAINASTVQAPTEPTCD